MTSYLLLAYAVTCALATQADVDKMNAEWRKQIDAKKQSDLDACGSAHATLNWHTAGFASASAVANIDPLTGIAGDCACILGWMQDCEHQYSSSIQIDKNVDTLLLQMKDIALGVKQAASYEKVAEIQLALKIASRMMGFEEFENLGTKILGNTGNWASITQLPAQFKDFFSQCWSRVRPAAQALEHEAGIELVEYLAKEESAAGTREVAEQMIEHEGAARVIDWIPFIGQIFGPISGAAFMTYTCHSINDDFQNKYIAHVKEVYASFTKTACPDALVSGESIFLTDGNGKNFGIQDGHVWQSTNRGSWERWFICRTTNGGDQRIHHGDTVILRNDACPQHNLGVDQSGKLWMSNDTGSWQTFVVNKRFAFPGEQEVDTVVYDGDQIYLTCLNGQHHAGDWKEHIGVDPSGQFWTGLQMGDWERFTVSKEHNDY